LEIEFTLRKTDREWIPVEIKTVELVTRVQIPAAYIPLNYSANTKHSPAKFNMKGLLVLGRRSPRGHLTIS